MRPVVSHKYQHQRSTYYDEGQDFLTLIAFLQWHTYNDLDNFPPKQSCLVFAVCLSVPWWVSSYTCHAAGLIRNPIISPTRSSDQLPSTSWLTVSSVSTLFISGYVIILNSNTKSPSSPFGHYCIEDATWCYIYMHDSTTQIEFIALVSTCRWSTWSKHGQGPR